MPYQVKIFEPAREYIESLKVAEQGTIKDDMEAMRSGDLQSVRTKNLRGKIYELIVGNHRITYFLIGNSLYFIRGFRKKSAKTPRKEIEYAEKIYRELENER